ncbi:MAG: hypothetical protein IV090_18615 [Candidatus Sericytochromatia bacterium]|nr:hypothetical protein [Candidatus Sericytochromatia bacterium]
MDQQRVNNLDSAQAYQQAQLVRDQERQNDISQLILAGPVPAQQIQNLPSAAEAAAESAPTDRVELTGKEPPVAPAQGLKTPEVGQPLTVQAGDISFKVDGRGAAVALQERLAAEKNTPQFAETAQALGVSDVAAFERAVEKGDALETFALVDPSNIYLVDAQRREINAGDLSAFANAELVIRPRGSESPAQADPAEKLLERLENPVLARINDPALQAQDALANRPPQPMDTQQIVG